MVAAAIAAVVLGVGDSGGTPPRLASTTGTTPVVRRDLVLRETASGTLGYRDSQPAFNRLGGTITRLPSEGHVARRGQTLFEVDGRPVVLMYGSEPVYRRLAAGVANGEDVAQLQRNLIALGFGSGVSADGHFGAATAAAIRRWQHAAGLRVTGAVELGRVVFLPGPRRVGTIAATLGGTDGGGGSGGGGGDGGSGGDGTGNGDGNAGDGGGNDGDTTPAAYRPEPTETSTTATTTAPPTTSTTPTTTEPTQTSTTPTTPQPTQTDPSSTPNKDGSDDGSGSGSGAGDGAGSTAVKVMDTTSTVRAVTIDLEASKQALARVGALVRVTLPDGTRTTGRITDVSRVAESSTSNGSTTVTIPVTVRLSSKRRLPSLDQAPVSVSFAKEIRRDVLAVPVTALVARVGGTYAVVSGRRTIPVTPGLFADGYVEVDGRGVHAGLPVQNAE